MGRPRKKILEPKEKILKAPVSSVRGMNDVLPADQRFWDYFLSVSEKFVHGFGFKKIETPVLEKTELFARGIGLATEIVEKEMFSFQDRGGESLSLRPEWTAGVCRAYIEHGLHTLPQPQKLYSFGPIFRHERPQAGRWRQFHQFNIETIGSKQPVLDAEIISLAWKILQNLGLKDIEMQINNIGCRDCRPNYKEILMNFLSRKKQKLCDDCRKRLKKNPLRVLDCKKERCQAILADVPQIIDYLCENCHNHFKAVLEFLDEAEIVYNLNPKLVRGLDYYTKTVFEILPKKEEEKLAALAGGGRYDDLIEILGGRKTPALGVSLGLERVLEQIKKQNIPIPEGKKLDVLFVQLSEMAKKKAIKIFHQLIENDIACAELFHKDNIQTQLKLADTLGVRYAVILGQKEVLDGTILIRDMSTRVQEVINLEKLIPELKRRLKSLG